MGPVGDPQLSKCVLLCEFGHLKRNYKAVKASELKIAGALTVRNTVLSIREGNKQFPATKVFLKEGWGWGGLKVKAAVGQVSAGPRGRHRVIPCPQQQKVQAFQTRVTSL